MRRTTLALMATTALAVANTTSAFAQVKDPQDARPSIQRDAVDKSTTSQRQSSTRQISDAAFVRRATLGNMFEVQSSRLALRKAQNEDVREFAEQLINDHQEAQNKLKEAAGDISFPRQLGDRQTRRLERLRQASDSRFDWRFISNQVRAHRRSIALFENFAGSEQNAANQDRTAAQNQTDRHEALVQWAQETLPTLREHLEMAQQIREDLRESRRGVASRQQSRQNARTGRMQSAEAARTLTIEQPAPQVSVQPRRPEVTVQQPQPKITIRQAPPTITIEQPQPEIFVQMPRPDVDIEQRNPQVSVTMPEPRLEVDRAGGQADVRVQSAGQPEAGQQHNVQLQRAQRPQVQYERTGEPKIVYRRAEGEPTVRYQSDTSGRQAQSDRRQQAASSGEERRRSSASQTASQSGVGSSATPHDWVSRARKLAGPDADEADRATTGKASAQSQPRMTKIEVGRLTDMEIYNSAGQELGEVDQVVVDQTSRKQYLILAHGGFAGLFEDEVAVPLERVQYRGDRLIVSGLTEEEIEDMPNWEDRVRNSQELEENQTVEIRLGQQ